MRCKDFNRLLNEIEAPDRSRAWRPVMDAHRAACPRCAEIWEAEQLLRAIVVPPLPPTLLERICSFIDQIAAGTVVSFPARRAIVVTGIVLVAAAAAATVELFDLFDGTVDAAPDLPAAVESVAEPVDHDPIRAGEPAGSGIPELVDIGDPTEAGPASEPATDPDPPVANDTTLIEPVLVRVDNPVSTEQPERVQAEVVESEVAVVEVAVVEATEIEVAVVDEPAEPEVPVEPPTQSRASIEMQAMLADLRFAPDAAAVAVLGEKFLGLIGKEFGEESREFARAQMLLAEEFRKHGDVVNAEDQLVDAINTLHAAGAADTEIVDPLLALGDLYEQAGDHAAALEQYQRARDIVRRAGGLLNPEQIRMFDRITSVYLAAGEVEKAKEVQEDAMNMARLTYSMNSVEALEASYRYAAWIRKHLGSNRRIQIEIQQIYLDAQQVIYHHFGSVDPRQAVYLLESLGRHALTGDFGGDRIDDIGVESLVHAREIAREIELDDPLVLALIERHLGDWRVMYGFTDQLQMNYGRAFELLGRLPDGDALRRAWFSEVNIIQQAPIESAAVSDRPEAPWVYMQYAFTIDIVGRPTDINLVRAEPPGVMEEAARVAIAASRFRPRLDENGRLIRSTAVYSMRIQYDPARARAR